jgi:small subunit ribosomal protein S1
MWQGLGALSAGPSAPYSARGNWEAANRALQEATILELPVVGFNRGGLLVAWNDQEGFVPISQLAGLSPHWGEEQRKQALQDRTGQTLRLRVIEVDAERNKLVFSERAASSDEVNRKALLDSLEVGEIYPGQVTSLCSFGAFVDLGGMEGLVHVSEISWGRVESPGNLLHVGQDVQVRILQVERERERVSLSIKRVQPDPWRAVEERYRVGQVVEGVITNVVDFGAFAQIENGLEGLIHISELAEGSFLHPRNVVEEGQIVQVRVINVDGANRRLGLSLRKAGRSDDPPAPAQKDETQS